MFIEASFVDKKWKHQWKHVVYPDNGIFLTNKSSKVLIRATAWTKLESVMLSGRSST